MLIDWCDTLHFEVRTKAAISREDLSVALPADDLILRAAQALQNATGTTQGAHISIEKRIPAQAGMGGGSSDAAATLLALNRLWRLNLSVQALTKIGLALGADVPFFVGGHNAWVEGIGEKISPIALPSAQFLVVKPPQGLETAKIFSHPELKRDTSTAIMTGFAVNPFAFGRNDLQEVAGQLCPQVNEGLEWLLSLGLHGRMTGSGSAVFAQVNVAETEREKAWVAGSLPPGFVVRQCNNLQSHPLLGWA
jgi:4-diphosphocytidyl-2-C-methyl-D-erythritol kinase